MPEMRRIVVSIDPAVSVSETSDETGIVAAGRGLDGHDYVLADRSGKVVGVEAAVRAWMLWQELRADEMVYEDNQGDEWVAQVLSDVWDRMQADAGLEWPAGAAPIRSVHAKRNKRIRAEPVAGRYEQGRVRHVRRITGDGRIMNDLTKLDEQLTEWVPGESKDSPDRLDALVYAVQRLRDTEGLGATVTSPVGGDDRVNLAKAIVEGDGAAVEKAEQQQAAEESAEPNLVERLASMGLDPAAARRRVGPRIRRR